MKRHTDQNHAGADEESKRRRQLQTQTQAQQLEAFEEDAQEIAALLRAQAGQNRGSGEDSGENVQEGGDNVVTTTVGSSNHISQQLHVHVHVPPSVHHGVLHGNRNAAAIIPAAPPRNSHAGALPQSQSAADSDGDEDDRVWLAPSQRRVSRVGNEYQVSLPKI